MIGFGCITNRKRVGVLLRPISITAWGSSGLDAVVGPSADPSPVRDGHGWRQRAHADRFLEFSQRLFCNEFMVEKRGSLARLTSASTTPMTVSIFCSIFISKPTNEPKVPVTTPNPWLKFRRLATGAIEANCSEELEPQRIEPSPDA